MVWHRRTLGSAPRYLSFGTPSLGLARAGLHSDRPAQTGQPQPTYRQSAAAVWLLTRPDPAAIGAAHEDEGAAGATASAGRQPGAALFIGRTCLRSFMNEGAARRDDEVLVERCT